MKRKSFSALLTLALVLAALPLTAAVNEAHASAGSTAVYKAYYDTLMEAVDKYGICVEPDPNLDNSDAVYNEWSERQSNLEYSGQGVIRAELIYFGDSALPQLLYIYDSGYGPSRYVNFIYVYGYTTEAILLAEGYIGGDAGGSDYYIATDKNGVSYLYNLTYDYDYIPGDSGDEYDYEESWSENRVYFTVKNGAWTAVPEEDIDILETRLLTWAPGTVRETLSELQSLMSKPTADDPLTGAASWAVDEVEKALEAGLVPDSIATSGWDRETTRAAAADAIVALIEKTSGQSLDDFAAERGWDLSDNQFSDTDSKAVTFLRYAGVTTGKGGNLYAPNDSYNRAEFVTMLGRTAENLFGIDAQSANPFPDESPTWAEAYIGYAAETGITLGSGGVFNPYGVLQNQQMAIFCYRAFNVWKDVG